MVNFTLGFFGCWVGLACALQIPILRPSESGSHLGKNFRDLDKLESPNHVEKPSSPESVSSSSASSSSSAAKADLENVPPDVFAYLNRTSQLVDITYCIDTTGLREPFSCVSRCREFPTLELVAAWHRGSLSAESAGYIAVDHRHDEVDESSDTSSSGESSEQGHRTGRDEGQGSGPRKQREKQAPISEIIVAFRGTYSIAETIADLTTMPQPYAPYTPDDDDAERTSQTRYTAADRKAGGGPACAGCVVHAGFLASWRLAREQVLPAVHALRQLYPHAPVHLVGHSMGGAVAVLAALDMVAGAADSNDPASLDLHVSTFGEPRLGNEAFVAYVNATLVQPTTMEVRGEGDYPPSNKSSKKASAKTYDKKTSNYHDSRYGDDDSKAFTSGAPRVRYYRVTHIHDPVPLLPPAVMGFRAHGGEIFISKVAVPPERSDVWVCHGNADPRCSQGDPSRQEYLRKLLLPWNWWRAGLWDALGAHRDYFWRIGLCVAPRIR